MNVLCTLEKNMYAEIMRVVCSINIINVKLVVGGAQLFIFFVEHLSTSHIDYLEKRVRVSNVIVDVTVSFNSISFCFMYFLAFLIGPYTLRIFMDSG